MCSQSVSAADGPPNNVSPPKRLRFSELHPYAIISLFDGVGSAIPAITKAIGGPPKLIIAAECDPILRQLVAEQFQFRTDGGWTQSSASTFTLYTHDIKELLRDHCRILREAFAIAGTQCRWIVIAGSPCQDLTLAGPFKGLLGITGQSSSLFYYVHVILWLLQTNYPTELIRFLLENAGTMLEIHRKAILRALGLNPDANPDYFRVDPKHTHGIKRNRFYFRNYTTATMSRNLLFSTMMTAKAHSLIRVESQFPLDHCYGYAPSLDTRSSSSHGPPTSQSPWYGTTHFGGTNTSFRHWPRCNAVTPYLLWTSPTHSLPTTYERGNNSSVHSRTRISPRVIETILCEPSFPFFITRSLLHPCVS